jgi:hypothetical protein
MRKKKLLPPQFSLVKSFIQNPHRRLFVSPGIGKASEAIGGSGAALRTGTPPRIGITQPSLSRLMRPLEEELAAANRADTALSLICRVLVDQRDAKSLAFCSSGIQLN